MKKSLMLLKIFLVLSTSVIAQDFVPKGHTYVNDTTDVFVLTPEQAQQAIYWYEDSELLPEVIKQYHRADSLNTLYREKIAIMEEEIEVRDEEIIFLEQEVERKSRFTLRRTLKWTGIAFVAGAATGAILN